MREFARGRLINFFEVNLICSVKTCRDRDYKNIYNRIDKDSKEALVLDKAIGSRIDEESIRLGLIIRPLYHICVLSPALIITKSQIDTLVDKLYNAIENSVKQLKVEGLWKG